MADQSDGTSPPPETDAASVPQGGWAIVITKGVPDADILNRIEADGLEIRHIMGPLNTSEGPVTQIYVKRISAIVRPPLRGL